MAAEEGKVELEEPTPEELKAMFEGWKVKPDSKKIELHTEDIDDTMCGRLAYAIGHTDHLTQLFLSVNSITPAGSALLMAGLARNSTIERMMLQDQDFGDAAAEQMATILKTNTVLNDLTLLECKIGVPGARALCGALAEHNTTMKVFGLGGNEIGDDGATAVADMIKTNTTLTCVTLTRCGIKAEGGTKLAEGLAQNYGLHTLSVSWNEVGSATATKMGEALKSTGTLRELRMQNDQLTDEGCTGLGEGLKSCTTLEMLRISLNPDITNAGKDALAAALERNNVLHTLSVETKTDDLRAILERNNKRMKTVVVDRLQACHLLTSIGQRSRDESKAPRSKFS